MVNAIRLQDVRAAIHGGFGSGGNTLSDLMQLMAADTNDPPTPDAPSITLRRLHSGDTLFHEGSHAEAIYFVRSGTFKVLRVAEDGYEQVLGFVGRAELLGFDAVSPHEHPNAAVALEDSSVYVLQLRDVFTLGHRAPALCHVVHLAVSNALARRGELAEVMAAVSAEVRLARFLVHLSQRMAAAGQSPRRFHLRMNRRDIASYLGVAHETISRSFGALVAWALVQVDNREVEVLDMDGLKAISRNTRRTVDEPSLTRVRRLSVVEPGVAATA